MAYIYCGRHGASLGAKMSWRESGKQVLNIIEDVI